jgi:hypothetical protein
MNRWGYTGQHGNGMPPPVRTDGKSGFHGVWERQQWGGISKCAVEGCDCACDTRGKDGNKGGSGNGYCPKHARNYYRYGHPLGRGQATWEEFTEAALRWADEQSEQACRRLVGAAWAWYRTRARNFPSSASQTASVDSIAVLVQAAWLYADAETMDDFLEARTVLREAASNIWRA